jgi:hypothetical protein
MEHIKLIQEIEAYCAAMKMAPSTFCLRAANNGTLYKRMTEGGDCGVKVLDKIRNYMRANPAPKRGATV